MLSLLPALLILLFNGPASFGRLAAALPGDAIAQHKVCFRRAALLPAHPDRGAVRAAARSRFVPAGELAGAAPRKPAAAEPGGTLPRPLADLQRDRDGPSAS